MSKQKFNLGKPRIVVFTFDNFTVGFRGELIQIDTHKTKQTTYAVNTWEGRSKEDKDDLTRRKFKPRSTDAMELIARMLDKREPFNKRSQ